MQPWHFFVIEGEGRERFSAYWNRGRLLPVVMTKLSTKRECAVPRTAHHNGGGKMRRKSKVPRWEQEMSAGCAVMAMQMQQLPRGLAASGAVAH